MTLYAISIVFMIQSAAIGLVLLLGSSQSFRKLTTISDPTEQTDKRIVGHVQAIVAYVSLIASALSLMMALYVTAHAGWLWLAICALTYFSLMAFGQVRALRHLTANTTA